MYNRLMNESDIKKLRAIETLVRNGDRSDEWAEAGLLSAIEKVLDGHDTSSAALEELMERASKN